MDKIAKKILIDRHDPPAHWRVKTYVALDPIPEEK